MLLSEPQVIAIINATRPLQADERVALLTALVTPLAGRHEIGDGELGRMLAHLQRQHFKPPSDVEVGMRDFQYRHMDGTVQAFSGKCASGTPLLLERRGDQPFRPAILLAASAMHASQISAPVLPLIIPALSSPQSLQRIPTLARYAATISKASFFLPSCSWRSRSTTLCSSELGHGTRSAIAASKRWRSLGIT